MKQVSENCIIFTRTHIFESVIWLLLLFETESEELVCHCIFYGLFSTAVGWLNFQLNCCFCLQSKCLLVFISYYSRPLFLWRSNTVIFVSLSVLRWRTRRQNGSNGKFLPSLYCFRLFSFNIYFHHDEDEAKKSRIHNDIL